MFDRELSDVKDTIQNALSSGMSYSDALLLAGASDMQIEILDKDTMFQMECSQIARHFELNLLNTLKDTIEIQASKGKDHGVTWLLSKINPSRWGGGDDDTGANVGSIVINTQPVDFKNPDNAVEVFDGDAEEGK